MPLSPRPGRLAAGMAASAAIHGLLWLLVAFAVIGPGGGLGVGSGPGLGVGAGRGTGSGGHGREIFPLAQLQDGALAQGEEELPARVAAIRELDLPPLRPRLRVPREAPPRPGAPRVRARRLPRPLGVGRDLGRALASLEGASGGFGGGGGGGLGWSLGSTFAGYVGGLRHTGLDVALLIDATGSMEPVLAELKARLAALVTTIQRLVPTARIGVVAYRDRARRGARGGQGGGDFVVRWSDLSFSGRKIEAFLSGLRAEGGGDWEEAVRAGLEAALGDLTWRAGAKKVLILVGGSPPHLPDRVAILRMVRDFHARGGVLSAIDVSARLHQEHERRLHLWLYGTEPERISPLPDFYREVRETFGAIAREGGGELLALGGQADLAHHLLALAFGRRWERDVARISRGMGAVAAGAP